MMTLEIAYSHVVPLDYFKVFLSQTTSMFILIYCFREPITEIKLGNFFILKQLINGIHQFTQTNEIIIQVFIIIIIAYLFLG